jgi:hypothetical protein
MLLWGHPLMKLFVLIVWPSVSFLFEITIKEFGDRYLRVITLEDKLTIHNAFPDRSFRP